MPDPASSRRNLVLANQALQRKRKLEQLERDDAENAAVSRVSPRTMQQLRDRCDAVTSERDTLSDRTNILVQQRDNHAHEYAAFRRRVALDAAEQDSQHRQIVSDLESRIVLLESRLAASDLVIADLKSKLRASEKRETRLADGREQYCARKVAQATSYTMMTGNCYTGPVRALVTDLVAIYKVPVDHVGLVIREVADTVGCRLIPNCVVSPHTVTNILDEARVASQLQIATKIMDPGVTGICLSSDGTSDRNLQFISRHMTVTNNGEAETLCLGMSRPVNHTVDTQLTGWREEIQEIGDTYQASPLSDALAWCESIFWQHFSGYQSDHASDQGGVARGLFDTKVSVDLQDRGRRAIAAMPPEKHRALLIDAKARMVNKCGGVLAWLKMPSAERARHEDEAIAAFIRSVGQAEFDALTPAQKESVRFFVRAGCCMHKELNCVLAGAKAMMASWRSAGLQGPMKLYNRDNRVASTSGSSAAQERAEEVTEAGGVKAAQLFGTLFNSTNDKKGYGDLFVVFMRKRLQRNARIPDSQACRYQSNYETARYILHHRELILEFLELNIAAKSTHRLNNLELNVRDLLKDGPTLTELAVLARYGTSVGRPYMRQVRATGTVNMLDLGPLHAKVIQQCDSIATRPAILAAPLLPDSHVCGTLDGLPFDDPELFAAVEELQRQCLLPHLDFATTAFFTGAREGWKHFTPEFAADGVITRASPAQRAALVIPATNDVNEGLLGAYRVIKRMKPSMRLRFFNAIAMYKRNKTGSFLRGLDEHLRRFLRREQRRRAALKLSKREDEAQMAYEQSRKAAYDEAQRKRAEEQARRERELSDFEPRRFLSIDEFRAAATVSGTLATMNIRWHAARGTDNVKAKLAKTKPQPKLAAGKRALLCSILTYMSSPDGFGTLDDPFPIVSDDSDSVSR